MTGTDAESWRIGTDEDVAWITAATTIGRTITSAIPPAFEAYATLLVPDQDAGRSEQVRALVRILRAGDGAERWVEARGRVYFDDAGRPVRDVGTLADVTERRRIELALQARTAELETVLDTVPIAVWLAHDVETRRITGNRAAANTLRLGATDNMSLAAPDAERPP
mgnify:CR=1 FL=1